MAAPPSLKPIQPYLKVANEYDKRDQVVAYFCRLYAVQRGIKIDSKTPECRTFLLTMMDTLEKVKKDLSAQGEEAVTNDIVGQAHVENVALKLFLFADNEDRQSRFNKNVVKAFYSSNLLFDVLGQFGELSEEIVLRQKYAKWKATYIHKCLQTGVTPQPGPEGSQFEDADFSMPNSSISEAPSSSDMPGSQQYPPYPAGQNVTPYPPSDQNVTPYPPADQNVTPYPPAGPSHYPQPQQPGSPHLQPKGTPTPYAQATKPQPPAASQNESYPSPSASASSSLSVDDYAQASKLCKYAMSALQYEDVPTAVDNLTKALAILQVRK